MRAGKKASAFTLGGLLTKGSSMRFGSVCSGIEAASVAWNPLGWEAAWLAEIEPFPSAVLKHHYPEVPNLGDMTLLPKRILDGEVEAPDLFCGGTPCQAFSVAGLRKSLDDARGNLSLTFCEIANAIDHVRRARGESPAIVFWENVPGVLSTKDNAFGCFISALAGCDTAIEPLAETGWTDAGVVAGPQRTVAWRILDAQFFGLAQRRRRVFVVASAREGFDPATVLLEFDGVRRDTAPSREAGQRVAPTVTNGPPFSRTGNDRVEAEAMVWPADVASTLNAHFGDKQGLEDQHALGGGRCSSPPEVAMCLNAGGMKRQDSESETLIPTIGGGFDVTHSLRGEGFDASEDGTGRGTPLVPVAFGVGEQPDLGHCLRSGASKADKHESTTYVAQPIAWDEELNPSVNQAGTLLRGGAGGRHDGVAVPVAFHPTQDPINSVDVCHAIGTGNGQVCATAAVAVDTYNHTVTGDYTGSLTTTGGPPLSGPGVLQAMQVRRLTPEECEALQGFPRLYTAIPWRNKPSSDCPDGPRYKALGNSWAVPVVRWIGKRIQTQLA